MDGAAFVPQNLMQRHSVPDGRPSGPPDSGDNPGMRSLVTCLGEGRLQAGIVLTKSRDAAEVGPCTDQTRQSYMNILHGGNQMGRTIPRKGDAESWYRSIESILGNGSPRLTVAGLATALGASPNTTGKYVALAEARGLVVTERVASAKVVTLPHQEHEKPEVTHRIDPPGYINQLFEGDCIHWMKQLPDDCIDMALCDLPYGTTQNRWDSVIPLDELWKEYRRIVKPNGAIVLTSQGIFTARLIVSNDKEFKYKISWEKSKPTNFLNAKKQPLRKHEDICVFYRRQPTYNPQMGNGVAYDKGIRKDQLSGSYGDFKPAHVRSSGSRYPTDVIYHKTAESEGQVWHPTQKPVGLGRYLVRTYSNPGDIVLDNAFGSGSFLVAALLEGRNFVGIEKNQEVHLFKKKRIDYVEVAHERIAAAFSVLDDEARSMIVSQNAVA